MAGIGLIWSIASGALSTQSYGIDVTAQNIANVNTPGYSRQRPIYETKAPAAISGLLMGQGVDMDQVMRVADQFIEDRLIQQESNLKYFEEMESYSSVLEEIFNENSEASISAMMAEFWNLWQDVSNNPSGTSERSALYQYSLTIAERFNSLDTEMRQLETDLTRNISGGIEAINQISAEIAEINRQIVAEEAGGNTANDMRDKRNNMLARLSEYVDTNSFEQDNGTLTVLTAKGCGLVQGVTSCKLSPGGINGDRVIWTGSGGANTDITNYISTGSLGGWLDVRDKILAECEMNLDALAKEFIFLINRQHAQGIGLEAFSSTTGSYAASLPDAAVGTSASGLSYYDKITDGSFKLWLYDENGSLVGGGATTITIDADVTALYDADPVTGDIAATINNIDANISASLTDGKLRISAANDYSFAFSEDTSNILAALGINTFFTGESAENMDVNDRIGSNINLITAALIDADGTFTSGDNRNALALSDIQNADIDISRWRCDRVGGNTEGTLTTNLEDYYHTFVGTLGVTVAGFSSNRSFHETMVANMGEIRDGISAVSLDEEMTNLIKYQHAYEAAAKLITVTDDMLNTLLELK